MRGARVFVALAVILGNGACSQSTAPSQASSAERELRGAKDVYERDGAKAALPLFERALASYRAAGDRHGEAVVTGLLGNCYKRLGEHARAKEFLDRALTSKRALGDELEAGRTLNSLGLLHWELGEYPTAIDEFQQAIEVGHRLGDTALEASGLNNLSLVFDELGEYGKSLPQYEKALELHRRAGFLRGEGDTLGNIGGVHMSLGRYREALAYYTRALAVSERLRSQPAMSQDLGNMALCRLALGETDEAAGLFDRALELARAAGMAKEQADWLKGKGSAELLAGRHDAALDAFNGALAVYEQSGLRRELVDDLADLADVYFSLGSPLEQERVVRRGIATAQAIGYAKGVTLGLLALGDLEWSRRRPHEAKTAYLEAGDRAARSDEAALETQALIKLSLVDEETGEQVRARRDAEKALALAGRLEQPFLQADALYALARIALSARRFEEARARAAEGEDIAEARMSANAAWRLAYVKGRALEGLGRRDEALAAYLNAVNVIESVRNRLRAQSARAGYLEDKQQVYEALVRLLVKMGRVREAFRHAEKLRAISYLEMVGSRRVPGPDSASNSAEEDLRARIRSLAGAVEAEAARPATERRGAALEALSSELDQAQRAYLERLDALRQRNPGYAAVRRLDVAEADDVARRLPPDAALIEYVVGEASTTTFVVTAGTVNAAVIDEGRRTLGPRVALLRDLVTRRGTAQWERPALRLEAILIEPLRRAGWLEGVRRLFIVPHGVLHYVPFAALLRADGHALVDDFVITTLPAATALLFQPARDPVAGGALAFAPGRVGLAHNRGEAEAVAAVFGAAGRALVGAASTEEAFKREAGGYRVLHVATHGYFNHINPLLSGVELEPGGHDDGRLEVYEILGLRLHAELVTLSACETALETGLASQVPAGEDFVGLTRAFLSAGTGAVLASLWAIDDQATAGLMRRFYEEATRDRAEALAVAQREMRSRGGREGHPFYWAPFVLVGAEERSRGN